MSMNHRKTTTFGIVLSLAIGGLTVGCSADRLSVEELLNKSAAAYKNHKGYFHRQEWRYAVEIPELGISSQGSGNHTLTVDEDRDFRFGEFDGVVAYRHGNELIAHRPYSGNFVSVDLVAGQSWPELVPVAGEYISFIDPAAMLATGEISDWQSHELIDFASASLISDDAQNRLGIRAPIDMSSFFGGPGDVAEFWFDADTYLLRSVHIDSLKNFIARQQLPESSAGQAYLALEMAEVVMDIESHKDELAFVPRPQDKQVERLVPPADDLKSASISSTVGQSAPKIRTNTLDGEAFDLDSLRGNVVLLDFWASWCGGCMRSKPAVKGIGQQFADNDFQIVSVSLDNEGDREVVRKIVGSSGIEAIQILDSANEISTDYQVVVQPTFVLLDQAGLIHHVQMGPLVNENLDELKTTIESLLET